MSHRTNSPKRWKFPLCYFRCIHYLAEHKKKKKNKIDYLIFGACYPLKTVKRMLPNWSHTGVQKWRQNSWVFLAQLLKEVTKARCRVWWGVKYTRTPFSPLFLIPKAGRHLEPHTSPSLSPQCQNIFSPLCRLPPGPMLLTLEESFQEHTINVVWKGQVFHYLTALG